MYPSTVREWAGKGRLEAVSGRADENPCFSMKALSAFAMECGLCSRSELRQRIRPVILVVDDDDMVRDSLKNLLKRSLPDAEIITAAGGFEAGQMVSVHVPDLILLDIMLPGIDGFKVCEEIKSQYPDIRILAITGYGSARNKERILSSGADGFLSKPVEVEKLTEQVHALIREQTGS